MSKSQRNLVQLQIKIQAVFKFYKLKCMIHLYCLIITEEEVIKYHLGPNNFFSSFILKMNWHTTVYFIHFRVVNYWCFFDDIIFQIFLLNSFWISLFNVTKCILRNISYDTCEKLCLFILTSKLMIRVYYNFACNWDILNCIHYYR